MQIFKKRTSIPVTANALYEWHMRPGAFERLLPPWERVSLKSMDSEIKDGARAVLSIENGPVQLDWTAEHCDVEEGKTFTDVQVSGPFDYWRHKHSFDSQGTGSVLEDRIEYRLARGLPAWLSSSLINRKLERMFSFRHDVTAHDLSVKIRFKEVGSMKVLVTGSSGLIGSALVPFLTTQGHQVVRMVRSSGESNGNHLCWSPAQGKISAEQLEGFDAVVNLSGDNIASGRWSSEKKKRLRDSRIDSTRLLVDSFKDLKNPPEVFISASAIGFYGDRGDQVVSEDSSAGEGFLADLCSDWEAVASAARHAGTRTVNMRIGVVLSPRGGMLEKVLTPFQLGAGGVIGSGKQYMSWISIDDVVGAIYHAIVNKDFEGPVNAVAPDAVTNSEFTSALGKVLARPTVFPVPGFGAKLAFGEMAEETMLASCRVKPTRLTESGYEFRHPKLETALRHVLGK